MNLGIFLNNTNSEIKYNINLVNFNNLKNNFDKIILVDIDNEYSNRLNTILKSSNENIVSYNIDNKYVKDSNNDFEINLISRKEHIFTMFAVPIIFRSILLFIFLSCMSIGLDKPAK